MILEDLELFCYYFVNILNYITENNINLENIYNMEEKSFFISCNKFRQDILQEGKKNLYLVQYNYQELITVMGAIYVHITNLALSLIFWWTNYYIGKLIHTERKGKRP